MNWEPEVGKHAEFAGQEVMIISEHCGYFWFKNKSATMSTCKAKDLLEPVSPENKLVNAAMNEILELGERAHNADRSLIVKMIRAGYRKIPDFNVEQKPLCGVTRD